MYLLPFPDRNVKLMLGGPPPIKFNAVTSTSYSVLGNRPVCNNEVSGPVVVVTDIGESIIKK